MDFRDVRINGSQGTRNLPFSYDPMLKLRKALMEFASQRPTEHR